MKRIARSALAAFLAALMILSALPFSVLAEPQGGETPLVPLQPEAEPESVWSYTSDDDGVTVTKYNGAAKVVGVPATLGGKNVVAVGGEAFADNHTIEGVVIPAGVTAIGAYAFSRCELLERVELPDGLLTLGDGAFYYCNSLKEIELPASVTDIGSYAFSDCASLKEIELPAGLTGLGNGAFQYTDLREIEIPAGVTVLPYAVFSTCSALEQVTLPAGLLEIGEYAFSNCNSLKEIDLPASVTAIGESAFSWCSSLTAVEIPAGVTALPYGVFSACSALERVTLPAGLLEIGAYAFSTCNSLKEIDLPAGLTRLGYGAFQSSGLREIEIPAGVPELENGVFSDCRDLARIVLPDNLNSIEASAFYNCDSLEEIELPAGLLRIGSDAFENCDALKEIVLPDGVTTLDGSTFSRCGSLKKVALSASLESVGTGLFDGCDSLEEVTVPASNTKYTAVGTYLIEKEGSRLVQGRCTGVIPGEAVKTVGQNAFYNTNGLAAVTLTEGVEKLEQYAFGSCYDLTVITWPRSLTAVGYGAFAGCSSLDLILYAGTEAEWNAVAIGDYNDLNATVLFNGAGVTASLTPPDKTVYYEGEEFSADGMEVILQYGDGETLDVSDKVTVAEPDLSAPGEKTVAVSFGDLYRGSFTVTVREIPGILADTPATAEIASAGDMAWFRFTPAVSGGYAFRSLDKGIFTAEMRDADRQLLESTSSWDDAFCLNFYLAAGETCYLRTGFSGGERETGSYSVEVHRLPDLESVVLAPAEITGYVGTTWYLSHSVEPTDAYPENVVWSSSDESVAAVSEYGAVSLVGGGTAVISAVSENSGVVGTCAVTVLVPVTLRENEPQSVTADPGEEQVFTFTPSQTGAYAFRTFDFSYDDNAASVSVERVNGGGYIGTGYGRIASFDLEAGETYRVRTSLYSYHCGESGIYRLETAPAAPATGVAVEPGTISGFMGDTVYLTYSMLPWLGIF